MSQHLKHIFDASACLSKRQLKDYAHGGMSREEQYAIEHHVNTCFFCSEAIEGLAKKENVLVAIDDLNTNFLKDHLSLINPQIHLNSIAPTVQAQPIQRSSKDKVQPFLKPATIAAALILGVAVLWYLDFGKNEAANHHTLAQQTTTTQAVNVVATPQENTMNANETLSQPNDKTVAQNTTQTSTNNNNDFPQKPSALLATNTQTEKPKPAADTHTKAELAENKKAPKTVAAPATTSAERNSLLAASDMAAKDERKETDNEHATSPDELFEKGNYAAALSVYKKEMNTGGNRAEQDAALQAARCHINLGQKEKAIKLLEAIAENGSGASKRQAKRLLKDLGKEVQE
ncbi:MAG TPA: tetratricopeptide repeat protein [Flavipsychrobacter sp.]|nr:tetratricopeptide repeat protein [Flavipsychrobacter sp.]